MGYRDQKTALRALTAVAVDQGGYFTTRQAREAGYGYPHVSYHLSVGNFERAGRGLYRIPAIPATEHDDLVRLWLWSRGRDDQPQAAVSHQTALALHELAEFIPTRIHLTVPPSFRRTPPEECVLHKIALTPTDTQEASCIRLTTPLRTLEDVAADPSLPTSQFEYAVETARRRGMIRPSDAKALIARRDSMNATIRSGTGDS